VADHIVEPLAAGLLPRTPTTRLGRRLARRPDWWLVVLASVGWLVLAGHELGRVRPASGEMPAHAGHAGHPAATVGTLTSVPLAQGFLTLLGWGAMIAVMSPLVGPSVRYAALRSPQRMRRKVTGEVVGGWAAVWILAAAVIGVAAWLLTGLVGWAAACLVAGAAACAWQYTRTKRRRLAVCQRLLAPPLGRARSRAACWRHGLRLGRDCVVSCGPLMTLMAVAGHSILVAVPLVGVAWYERFRRPHHDPGTGVTSMAIAATAVGAAVAIAVGAI
jgi:hypothetical protein